MKSWLALALLAPLGRAGEVCHTTTYPAAVTNWSQTFVVPKHDPALGSLQSVAIRVRCTLTGAVGAESPSPLPATYETHLAFRTIVRRPDTSSILEVEPSVDSYLPLGTFDGTIDFAGTSGVWLTGLQAARETDVVLGGADLAAFTAASAGDSIGLGVQAIGVSTATGPGALVTSLSTSAEVSVTVCYGYREVRQLDSMTPLPTNSQHTRYFVKHDPAVGPLRAVRLRARTTLSGSARCENPVPQSLIVTSQLGAVTRIERLDGSPAFSFETTQPFLDSLTGYDGGFDFGGSSGVTHASIAVEGAGWTTLTSPADLALFTAASVGEMIGLVVRASATSFAMGGGPILTQFTSFTATELEVVYDFAAPIDLYCFGDGLGLPCICGNSPVGAQQGCLNSFGLGGELRASGFAEIGADTVVLTASNLPTTTSVLLYQGTTANSSVFGDGLRCAGGTLRRLGTRNAAAGSAAFPSPGNTISTLGGAATGSTLCYQAWYRNVVPFCTPSGFNLTNAVAISW